MKKIKLLIILYIFIFTFIHVNIVQAADDTVNQSLNADISKQAIEAPLTLPVWIPPYYAVPVAVKTINHLNILRSVVAPALTGAGLIKKPKPKDKNSEEDSDIMMSENNDINNFGNEEILYNIDFKNSAQTPIYKDTLMFIKIPDWLKYSYGSLKLNNEKLTDEKDKDRLTFLMEDKILQISLENLNTNNKITLTFGAKPITTNIPENNSYCLIKFQSKSKNTEMGWLPFAKLEF